MPRIIISDVIRAKIASLHDVGEPEVKQCFANRTGGLLLDLREQHKTDPTTRWFIAPTTRGRLLKVCYVPDGDFFLRSCFEPDDTELAIYRKHGKPTDF